MLLALSLEVVRSHLHQTNVFITEKQLELHYMHASKKHPYIYRYIDIDIDIILFIKTIFVFALCLPDMSSYAAYDSDPE